MQRRNLAAGLVALAFATLAVARALAQPGGVPDGLVSVESRHGPMETVERFEAVVRAEGWIVFARIDHAAAAAAAGLTLRPRTVIIFGNPRAGTPAMAAHPTLALDLPLRLLVWEDDAGRTWLSRNGGTWMAQAVYGRHGMTLPPAAVQGMETLLARLASQAAQ